MLDHSIYSVFERMWRHIVTKFNNYVPIEALDNHIENQKNPHNVTKYQVGLSNVDNTSDLEKPISDATLEALSKKADSEILDNHVFDIDNPHAVNAEQVGAISINGGAMEDTLKLRGIVLTEGIDYGSGDPAGGVLGQLYFKKVT